MNIQNYSCSNLETSRLFLRILELTDSDELYEVYSDEETTHHVPRKKHENKNITINYLEKRIAGMNEGKSFVWSVIDKIENKVIGTVNLYFKPDKVASIGVVLHRDFWRRGIATEALSAVVRFGFEELQLIRIEGKFESGNSASEKVLKKLGMTYEGTLRKEVIIKGISCNVKIYSLLFEEYKNSALGETDKHEY